MSCHHSSCLTGALRLAIPLCIKLDIRCQMTTPEVGKRQAESALHLIPAIPASVTCQHTSKLAIDFRLFTCQRSYHTDDPWLEHHHTIDGDADSTWYSMLHVSRWINGQQNACAEVKTIIQPIHERPITQIPPSEVPVDPENTCHRLISKDLDLDRSPVSTGSYEGLMARPIG